MELCNNSAPIPTNQFCENRKFKKINIRDPQLQVTQVIFYFNFCARPNVYTVYDISVLEVKVKPYYAEILLNLKL